MKRLKRIAFLLATAGQLATHSFPAHADSTATGPDPELTNYKSGISLTWQGIKGVDYMEEYFYFDKVISDRKVVYLKARTQIVASHNERNIAGASNGADRYQSVSPTAGTIRLKPDGDHRWELYPTEWTTYTGPFCLADLTYTAFGDPDLPVVGATGHSGGPLQPKNKRLHYHRGIQDSVGDEWHTLTVADDDSAVASAGDTEYDSSDGRIFYIVINPKTPALTIRATVGAQFYTTPPKKYFVPLIYDQTTYFNAGMGSVSFQIKDINERNVFYRVVTQAGSSTLPFTRVKGSSVTIGDSAFRTGVNYLQYYCEGNNAHVKTRVVVKDPGFPSKDESHGDKLWVDASYWEKDVVPRLSGIKPQNFDSWITTWSNVRHSADKYRNGKRNDGAGLKDAIVARYHGMHRAPAGDKVPNSQWAKRSMFEFVGNVDPVGAELNPSNRPVPSREWFYRGYTDINNPVQAIAAYDILAGYYRTDQGHQNGLSPIEDYFIRDAFASYVHVQSLLLAGYGTTVYKQYNAGGMWDTARMLVGTFITCLMPSYSSPVYGTSGMDGNQTTYPWCPFRDDRYTWKQMFLLNNTHLNYPGFPNVSRKVGFEDYLITEDGAFVDRPGYLSTTNMGHVFVLWWNLQKLFNPDHNFDKANAYLERAASGKLHGLKSIKPADSQPITNFYAGAQNGWFPRFRNAAREPMLQRTGTNSTNAWNKQTQQGGPLFAIWYDHELPDAKSREFSLAR